MKILLFANSDWYLYNFRLALARALYAQGHEVILLSPPGKYAQHLQQAGFRWIAFPFSRRGVNPWQELSALWRLIRLYRRERPDLVHHFTIKCVLYGSVAARLARIGAIVNAITGLGHVFSGTDLTARLTRPWVRMLYRLALRRTQVIFQNPEDRAAFVHGHMVTPARSHLIPGSGVDVERFRPVASRVKRDSQSVLLASRLIWAKGIGDYVAAAGAVRRQLPGVAFLIAGEADTGNPGAIPRDTIERWREQGDVTFLGHRDDMAELLQQVDVSVLPSYYGEGVPRCLIEAAASGVALVASDTPGCREVVRHGVNGLLVPPRDCARLAETLLALLQDSDRLAAMGRHSREIACGEFSERQVIDQTLQVYRSAHP